jgi:hypothetical protein
MTGIQENQKTAGAKGVAAACCDEQKPILVVKFKGGNATPPVVPPGFLEENGETKDGSQDSIR